MVKFNEDHKKEMSGDFFPEGVHPVKIASVVFDSDDKEREYVDIVVEDDEGRNGTARMWFTTDNAINYTFNILRGIFVHNAPKDKKDAMREQIDNLEDTAALEKACKMLVGKKCWYQVVKTDRTYLNAAGETKHSYNRNVYGYEPSPKSVSSNPEGVEDVDLGKANEPIKVKGKDGKTQEIADF